MAQNSPSPLRVLDDATSKRRRTTLLAIGTDAQLGRAEEEIRALYAASPAQREVNAANLAKLHEVYEICRHIVGRG